jgi:hypothetical protein
VGWGVDTLKSAGGDKTRSVTTGDEHGGTCCNPSARKLRQEDLDFRARLDYIECSRQA